MKIGIIREGKVPPDSRVPLNPTQCEYLRAEFGLDIVVQPSQGRVYKDEEYTAANVPLQEDLSDCDVLMGVKEVPIKDLMDNKPYFFFSHTHKKQLYNRPLLKAAVDKNIQLIDYEVLTNRKGKRVIAFGYYAGVVGAHNGMWTYAQRTKSFELPRMKDLFDYEEAKSVYSKLELPAMKIVLTGGGRVAKGALAVLEDMGIERVSPEDFLSKQFTHAVYTQLNCPEYVQHKEGKAYDKAEYYQHPERYESAFAPYAKVSDLFINGIYWDNRAPAFFTQAEMATDNFNIQVIADVTCDIAPVASIPATIKASTIAEPVFGFDPVNGEEVLPYSKDAIDMMTIDNLPSELPRDASTAFGEMFMREVLPHLLAPNSAMIERASITKNGALGPHFTYLEEYLAQA